MGFSVRVWNTATGDIERVIKGHTGWVWSVAFSDDGTRLGSGADDRTVRIWNVMTGKTTRILEGFQFWKATTGKARWVLRGHLDIVLSVAFSGDGTHLVSSSVDRTIRIWNPNTPSFAHHGMYQDQLG